MSDLIIDEIFRFNGEVDPDGDMDVSISGLRGETYIDAEDATAIIKHLQRFFELKPEPQVLNYGHAKSACKLFKKSYVGQPQKPLWAACVKEAIDKAGD